MLYYFAFHNDIHLDGNLSSGGTYFCLVDDQNLPSN